MPSDAPPKVPEAFRTAPDMPPNPAAREPANPGSPADRSPPAMPSDAPPKVPEAFRTAPDMPPNPAAPYCVFCRRPIRAIHNHITIRCQAKACRNRRHVAYAHRRSARRQYRRRQAGPRVFCVFCRRAVPVSALPSRPLIRCQSLDCRRRRQHAHDKNQAARRQLRRQLRPEPPRPCCVFCRREIPRIRPGPPTIRCPEPECKRRRRAETRREHVRRHPRAFAPQRPPPPPSSCVFCRREIPPRPPASKGPRRKRCQAPACKLRRAAGTMREGRRRAPPAPAVQRPPPPPSSCVFCRREIPPPPAAGPQGPPPHALPGARLRGRQEPRALPCQARAVKSLMRQERRQLRHVPAADTAGPLRRPRYPLPARRVPYYGVPYCRVADRQPSPAALRERSPARRVAPGRAPGTTEAPDRNP